MDQRSELTRHRRKQKSTRRTYTNRARTFDVTKQPEPT